MFKIFKLFKPQVYVPDIYQIDYNQLEKKEIKLICFDLDNTLDKPDELTTFIDYQLKEKLMEIQKKFEILIVSNNLIKNRVASFADQLSLNYIEGMHKPFLKKYKNSKIINKYNKDEVVFIGDKVSTDIVGANRFGSPSILVDPLYPKNKKWYARLMSCIDKTVEFISRTKRGQYFNEWSLNE